jgi:hypothetical protein
MDTNGATTVVGNFNWMRATVSAADGGSTPFDGTAVSLPGTVEAENFDDGGEGVHTTNSTPATQEASTGRPTLISNSLTTHSTSRSGTIALDGHSPASG